MVRRTTTKKGKKYFYYHCSTYKRKEGCSSHNISDIKLRKAVLEDVYKRQDYCIGDKNKKNDVITFVIYPYILNFDDWKKVINNLQKKDLKHTRLEIGRAHV